jgi:general stress protein 26
MEEPKSKQWMANERDSDIKKIAELMKDIKFAMLTTVEENGRLHSRPMTTQSVEFDGDLWFFTRSESPKAWELQTHRQVSVTFADPGKSKFLTTTGTATLVHDRAKVKEFWTPVLKVFFPGGVDDPELALLKVTVETAEYWDSAPTAVGRAYNLAKAYVTKDPGALGDHAKVAVK